MKRIIIPIDFSVNAFNALHFAEALAIQARIDLTLVHVIPIQLVGATEVPVLVLPDDETLAYYTKKTKDLARQVELENEFRFEVEGVCSTGLFLDELLRQIRIKGTNVLVVMGTRGADSFLDKLIGTNTASIMKNAPCPILAIPVNAHFQGLNKIVYATDLKSKDDIFLNQLNEFASLFQSEISIIHVKDEKHLKDRIDVITFEKIIKKFPDHKYSFVEVKGRNAVDGIQTFINENSIDIVALAIHERNMLEDLFHSSVSRKLAFHCTVPILSLPEKQKEITDSKAPERDAVID